MPKVFVGEREVLAPPSATPFARNVMHFVRLLRTAGLAIGPDRLLDALHALTLVDLSDRIQVKAALAAVLLRKYEEEALFDQAFALFWRDPDLQAKMMALLLPQVEGRAQSPKPPAGQRIAEAFFPATKPVNDISTTDPREIDIDATLTWSEEERLRHADFETLTVAEWQAVKRLMARLTLPLPALPSRRFSAAPHARGGGRFDLRRTLRASLGVGGDSLALHWKRPRTKHPPLVVLADISGSMHRYTRMLLHFLHAVTHDHDRVETFLFGTQLTRISRELKHRDIDQAINKVTQKAADWAGGTRIGPCLREFNFRWARRVLGQNAVVLLISDGLDRDESGVLEGEMARLAGTCHRLIWLNPLLRYAGFEAKPAGVRAMLPYVDEFLPVHNLDSIAQLAEVFSTRNSRPSAWQRGL